jgi:hypothetical protein
MKPVDENSGMSGVTSASPSVRQGQMTAADAQPVLPDPPLRVEPLPPDDYVAEQQRRWVERNLEDVPWRVLGWAGLAVIAAGWSADALKGEVLFKDWWAGFENWRVWTMLLSVLLFAAATWRLYVNRQELIGVHALHQYPAQPRDAIILTVSKIGNYDVRLQEGEAREIVATSLSIPVTGDLARDIEALQGTNWPWQQMLRALQPHHRHLRFVYLIGSDETHSCLPRAKALVHAYLPQLPVERIRCHEQPAPFDEVQLMMREYADAIAFLKRQGMRESHITIDVTGGFKSTSVAGAMMTVSTNVVFQYVHTEERRPEERVQECDLVHTLGHAG